MENKKQVKVYTGDQIARYGFPDGHPFSPLRHGAFVKGFINRKLDQKTASGTPIKADKQTLALFHTEEHIDLVEHHSSSGYGYLDTGDTPAYKGVFEDSSFVAGTVLAAADEIMNNNVKRAFVPIAGLHHARRNRSSGFCVFNDCGITIEHLKKNWDLTRIAYVDIDAHHGDGVYYGFEPDPTVIFADLHEDGRYIFPGTGSASETGIGEAEGTKLNIPMAPGSNDSNFMEVWPLVLEHLEKYKPQFIMLQCGVDSMKGDPLTHLEYSGEIHYRAAKELSEFADKYCEGKLLAVGGGGYNLANIEEGWNNVVEALL